MAQLYEQFFTKSQVRTFKHVKKAQMKIAEEARAVAAEMVGGTIEDDGHVWVYTEHGAFRLAMNENSDNSTEKAAHEAAGVETVIMGDRDQMVEWFALHGLPPFTYTDWFVTLRKYVDGLGV